MLQIRNLAFSYPNHPVITGLSAVIEPGVTFVRGGDGRGKTSLLRLLAGNLKPDAGDLLVNGISLRDRPTVYRAQFFCMDPRNADFDQVSVNDFFESQRTAFPAFDFGGIPELAEGLDLCQHTHKKLYMLSTGSKRTCLVAWTSPESAEFTRSAKAFRSIIEY